jgi:hypothetical protein
MRGAKMILEMKFRKKMPVRKSRGPSCDLNERGDESPLSGPAGISPAVVAFNPVSPAYMMNNGSGAFSFSRVYF